MALLEREAHFELIENAGEARLRLFAPSVPRLFLEAAHAVAELVGADLEHIAFGPTEVIHLEASDHESLLIDWFNALGARVDETKRAVTAVAVDRLTDRRFAARVHTQPVPYPAMRIRAARHQGSILSFDPRHGCVATMALE